MGKIELEGNVIIDSPPNCLPNVFVLQVTGGADETLRLWKCFAPDPSKKDYSGKSARSSCLLTRAGIR